MGFKQDIAPCAMILGVIVLPIVTIPLTGMVFDYMRWSYFNTWALAHGAILVLLPIHFVIALVVAFVVYRFAKRKNDDKMKD